MKLFLLPVSLLVCLAFGCAHSPQAASSISPIGASEQPPFHRSIEKDISFPPPASTVAYAGERYQDRNDSPDTGVDRQERATIEAIAKPSGSAAASAASDLGTVNDQEYLDYVGDEEGDQGTDAGIADPLESFNRAMYHFNDKLYFWVLKPVAQGYSTVVPEGARVSVGNFFSNLAFPIRFVNCLLQGNLGGAANEVGRFMMNTIWGIGGLLDPASKEGINLRKQDEDLGQTLGSYGVGQGFYINWPILGPSSPRDTIGAVGDFFLHPLSYVNPTGVSAGIKGYDRVNDTSLRIGDYESLKEAALDPYIAIRNAYVQYRLNKVKKRGTQEASPSSGAGP